MTMTTAEVRNAESVKFTMTDEKVSVKQKHTRNCGHRKSVDGYMPKGKKAVATLVYKYGLEGIAELLNEVFGLNLDESNMKSWVTNHGEEYGFKTTEEAYNFGEKLSNKTKHIKKEGMTVSKEEKEDDDIVALKLCKEMPPKFQSNVFGVVADIIKAEHSKEKVGPHPFNTHTTAAH